MQKKIIALAVAGLMSGAAFAQSNVTISGRVDVGYHHSSVSKMGGAADTKSGIQSGIHDGSRLAFAGEENLGNGLKALFMLEYTLSNDVSAGVGSGASSYATTAASRQQWLGLAGSFGTVQAGQLYTPSDDMGMYDSMDQTAFSPRVVMIGGVDNLGTRWNNSVKYTSQAMSGFTVSAIYGFAPTGNVADTAAYDGSTATTNDQERAMGFGVTYANGPLSVSLYHDRANDIGNVTSDDGRVTRLGGSYDFGPVALLATYEKGSLNGTNSSTGVGTDKGKLWSLGGTAPLGNGLLRVMYSKVSINDDASVSSDGARGWGIGYDYNLSKRTMLYTGYTRVSSDSNNGFGYDQTPGNGGRYTGYGFGMLHKF